MLRLLTILLLALPALAPVLFMIPVWLLAILNLVLDLLKNRDSREILAFRRHVAGARRFFMQELQKPRPDLHDEWFPYVLASGLGAYVDQWFRAFGGAGATGTWGPAAAAMASGVAAPSSSGSGGGGGGGGSSSGGGGGGGW
ncbi:MAG TPA: hypothetical protein VEO54_28070 [Thermoanaerobaculia bacterium]|nr:hypothetical protein [Thermoanaerobaculia bacterium]